MLRTVFNIQRTGRMKVSCVSGRILVAMPNMTLSSASHSGLNINSPSSLRCRLADQQRAPESPLLMPCPPVVAEGTPASISPTCSRDTTSRQGCTCASCDDRSATAMLQVRCGRVADVIPRHPELRRCSNCVGSHRVWQFESKLQSWRLQPSWGYPGLREVWKAILHLEHSDVTTRRSIEATN